MYIRNFCILAHIDHGKSTLADRFLEITKTIPRDKIGEQFLDLMDLEKEKGITIKMQPIKMNYVLDDKSYILNLIDTPGHIDFSYEVSRVQKAVEGAILLVDAKKGIQAQTLSNFLIAKKEGLTIIPALNKIDICSDNLKEKKEVFAKLIGEKTDEISLISAKYGDGTKELLEEVIKKTPPPKGDENLPFSALIFDSEYDSHLGIIVHLRVFNGKIFSSRKCFLYYQKEEFLVKSLGVFSPQRIEQECLCAGEIGWIATGIKEPGKIFIGDTISDFTDFKTKKKIFVSKGFQKPQSQVFANLYPQDSEKYDSFKEAILKIHLTDPSFTFKEVSTSLGRGFLAGFLGLLHLEIIAKRLERECEIKTSITMPTVSYKIKTNDNEIVEITDISKMPSDGSVKCILEPIAKLKVITPSRFLSSVMSLIKPFRLKYLNTETLEDNILIEFETPLSKIICDFSDALQLKTEGFGSFSYELIEWRESNISKLEILAAKEVQPAFSMMVHDIDASRIARSITKKLKENLPRQQFPVIIQAVFHNKIIARETISAFRKDVTAPLYGGDITRKKKLLTKQRKHKKQFLKMGKVKISPDIFLKILKR